jgi:hypothetical protein
MKCRMIIVDSYILATNVKKKEAKTTRTRLPIAFTTLKKICLLLRKGMFSPYIDCLMETARVIAFFGFLRCGEFTVLQSFDPDSNVCSEDMEAVTIKQVGIKSHSTYNFPKMLNEIRSSKSQTIVEYKEWILIRG